MFRLLQLKSRIMVYDIYSRLKLNYSMTLTCCSGVVSTYYGIRQNDGLDHIIFRNIRQDQVCYIEVQDPSSEMGWSYSSFFNSVVEEKILFTSSKTSIKTRLSDEDSQWIN
jgi:hypothetical protein